MAKMTIEDLDLKDKKVLVRVDFNVPLKDGEITDDTRIKAALPTIKYVLDHDGKAILFSHLGRVKYWASLGDVFVNDAFGTAHRAHASNVGIASTGIPTVAGFLMEKEINFVGGLVENPKRPMVAILGGAKVSDKIGVIENLIDKADKILIGGGMTYTFYKALGQSVGKSICELDKVDLAKSLLEKADGKIILPIDSVCADDFSNDAHTEIHEKNIPDDLEGLDIGPKTVELFTKELQGAKSVVWNGPMGVFELSNFAKGTIGVCKAIAELPDAITIIGGGDSAAAAEQLGFADKFTHISTGGGASLELLEGKTLPGLAAINDK